MPTTTDRDEFLDAARAWATKGGNGPVIHSFVTPGGGMMLGADWDAEVVLAAIRTAKVVQWSEPGSVSHSMGHQLVIQEPDGRIVLFQVEKPE